jgi:TPR repeat protein
LFFKSGVGDPDVAYSSVAGFGRDKRNRDSMVEMQIQLDKLRSDAAECRSISNLATGEKGGMLAKIAKHLDSLAVETEKTIAVNAPNLIPDKPLRLENIRSDAAECLLLGQLADSDTKKELFSKIAEHLNGLALQIDKATTNEGENNIPADHSLAQQIMADLVVARNQDVSVGGVARHQHAARSQRMPKRMLIWLLAIVAAPIMGLFIWTNGHLETVSLTNDLASARRYLETKAALFSKTDDEVVQLKTTAGAATAELQQERLKTAALTNDLASARRDLEKKAALLSKTDDEVVRLKKTADAATAELQQERLKTAALTNDLGSAQRDLGTKAALSSKTDDEVVQLKKTSEAATAELQQERLKTAALTNDLSSAERDLETRAALLNKTDAEVVRLKKTAEVTTAELQQERLKTASSDRNASAATKPGIATASEQPSTSDSKVDPQAAHLMERAKSLLSQGDINGARVVLQRVVQIGSADASFAIAETYDPRVLSRWNVYGTRGDVSKAREFYAKAAEGGIAEAKDRLLSLTE